MTLTPKIFIGALAAAGMLTAGLTQSASAQSYVAPTPSTAAYVYTPGYWQGYVAPPTYVPYPTYTPYPTYVPPPYYYQRPLYIEPPPQPWFGFSFGFGGHDNDHRWDRDRGGWHGGHRR